MESKVAVPDDIPVRVAAMAVAVGFLPKDELSQSKMPPHITVHTAKAGDFGLPSCATFKFDCGICNAPTIPLKGWKVTIMPCVLGDNTVKVDAIADCNVATHPSKLDGVEVNEQLPVIFMVSDAMTSAPLPVLSTPL